MPALDFKVYVPASYVVAWERAGGDIEQLPKLTRQRVKDMLDMELKLLQAGVTAVVPEPVPGISDLRSDQPVPDSVTPITATTETVVSPSPPEPVIEKKAKAPRKVAVSRRESVGSRREMCVHRVSPAGFCKICD
jgi:hypothetical protein